MGSGPSGSVRTAVLTDGAQESPQASGLSATSFDRPPMASGLMQGRPQHGGKRRRRHRRSRAEGGRRDQQRES